VIAADTSSLVEFFSGGSGNDVSSIADAMKARVLFLSPPVLSEILSDPEIPEALEKVITQFPILETRVGFWQRAGKTRALVLAQGKKVRLGDALIAQFCLDHDIALITRYADFSRFEKVAHLKVIW